MSQSSLGEFELINKFFQQQQLRQDVLLGVGDDAALVSVPEQHQLAISTDTLVESVHFFPDIPPRALGHKALAVNLSDMAAMGAEPRWVTLAITLPEVKEAWLEQFCQGFFELAEYFNVSLVGGDTTRGPLSITVNVQGTIPHEQALTRDQAFPGDWLYVTGELGDSALALAHLQGKLQLAPNQAELALQSHYYPQPRVLAGYSLRGVASSCIDLSDGLYGDLQHVLKRSECGAVINLEQLPLSANMRESTDLDSAIAFALSGGEDYELCFTVPETNRGMLETTLAYSGVSYACIGQLSAEVGKIKLKLDDKPYQLGASAWDHFS